MERKRRGPYGKRKLESGDGNPEISLNHQADRILTLNQNDEGVLDIDDLCKEKRPDYAATLCLNVTDEEQTNVKLLEHSDIQIDRDLKRKACSAAKTKSGKEGSVLLYRLCNGIFTIEEMASCRGLGIGQAKTDPSRPTLDQAKIKLLKDYVVTWCKTEMKRIPTEAEMNGAITERIGYARKQMKARK